MDLICSIVRTALFWEIWAINGLEQHFNNGFCSRIDYFMKEVSRLTASFLSSLTKHVIMNTAQATFNREAHTTFNRELVISFIFYYVVNSKWDASWACLIYNLNQSPRLIERTQVMPATRCLVLKANEKTILK